MKKKPAKKKQPVGDLVIEELLLLKLLRADAELKNAVLSDKLAQAEHRIAEFEWGEKRNKLAEAVREANNNFRKVVSDVEARYDINMKEYAYDPDTGLLTPLDQ